MSDRIIVICPNCQTHFIAASSHFLPNGRNTRCSKCDNAWFHSLKGSVLVDDNSEQQTENSASTYDQDGPLNTGSFFSSWLPVPSQPVPALPGGASAPAGPIGPNFFGPAIDRLSGFVPVGIFKGFFAAFIVACAAKFVSEQYGAPAMLMALLIGMALQFMHEDDRCRPGIEFTAKTVLRMGVALLGLRISAQMLAGLGASSIMWIMAGVVTTILCGLAGARLLSRGWQFGFLTGGAVAICGASAAMAIAAILPKNKDSEINLTFTVIGVTMLSTIAMIFYPLILGYAGLDDRQAGFFIGATIHDVAQVVGAGYTISDEAGDVATVVKMLRVAMLAPVVFFASLIIARVASSETGQQPPLLPAFVVAFLVLASLNSVVTIPAELLSLAEMASKWMLLIAVAAVGMKTSMTQIKNVGPSAIMLIVGETVFLAGGFVLLLMFVG